MSKRANLMAAAMFSAWLTVHEHDMTREQRLHMAHVLWDSRGIEIGAGMRLIDRAIVKASREMRGA